MLDTFFSGIFQENSSSFDHGSANNRLLIDPMTGFLSVANDPAQCSDMIVDPVTGCLVAYAVDDSENSQDMFDAPSPVPQDNEPPRVKPKPNPKRIWSLDALKDMAAFILSDEERIVLNQKLRVFDAAKDHGLYVDVDTVKHVSEVKTAIDDILVTRKPIVGYNGGLWPLMMSQSRMNTMKSLASKSSENAKNKDKMKKSIRNTATSDFAIEMVNQMALNWSLAKDERVKHIVELARIDQGVREKNLNTWITFLKEIMDEESTDDVLG